ncbi:MAG: UDP-N-acetylglucosamine 2-epimerase (non-hydrolyzing) [Candidatus Pacebacteria bacterium]|nr:UDP-N-acetylglucosamine 2-epimerase (non-hydrolyzing) [Candidatus Paceibacterota bacterium]
MKLLIIVGARPNFIKVAPLIAELNRLNKLNKAAYCLVHTGQHYDYEMSQVFFQELKIPKPDYNLGIGSGSHSWQTAKIMEKLEPIILKERPDVVVVVGDVNSTLAGALVAAKLRCSQTSNYPTNQLLSIAHIEAGLRSFDMRMPEEINRLLTDHISDCLFVTEPAGVKNLLNEGINKEKIYLVGDIMINTLVKSKTKIQKSKILKKLNLAPKQYAVLTLHRPANVDNPENLKYLFDIFTEIQKKIKIVFPVHPRTKSQLSKMFKQAKQVNNLNNLQLVEPLGYIDFLALVSQSKFVLTDSGGVQEETTFLKIPCLTLRENTERPITIEKGTNVLCGKDRKKILKEVNKILNGREEKGQIPKLWDGKTAERIIKILCQTVKD